MSRRATRSPTTLAEAVTELTAVARAKGRDDLVRSASDWEALVQRHIVKADVFGFMTEAGDLVAADLAEAQLWNELLTNIWNTTPQPDRAGLTAFELFKQGRRPPRG